MVCVFTWNWVPIGSPVDPIRCAWTLRESLSDPGEASDDMTRITLRLSGPLKARVDAEAAAAGLSVNAWLVRAITRALDQGPGKPPRTQRGPGTRFTGYARG